MRIIVALGMALAVGTFALVGLDPTEAVAVPDGPVTIHTGGLKEPVTTVNLGEPVTWINASGAPAVRLIFEPLVGAPESNPLFTSSVTLMFSYPGVYPYAVFKGGGKWAWPTRGKIVVK
ncbi:MAG: hypothetical protein ACREIN_03220 [Candidatus Methylomirabilaceae bacterium]